MLIKWSQSMFKVLVIKHPDGDVEHVYLKAFDLLLLFSVTSLNHCLTQLSYTMFLYNSLEHRNFHYEVTVERN